jgi:hypothetical protein
MLVIERYFPVILHGLGVWCLTLLSIIFQLYRAGQRFHKIIRFRNNMWN